jgi:hypothetical protein
VYVPHFAVALSIKSRVRPAPMWALVTGAFLPDLVWMSLARAGVEPAQPSNFFDDWSHSLLSILVFAVLFAGAFWRKGRIVVLAIWLAVFSHFLLDLPFHPKRLALYPESRLHLGSVYLLSWGSAPGWFGVVNDWWVQTAVLLSLIAFYVVSMKTANGPTRTMLAPIVLLVGLELLTLAPCIGY